MAKAFRPSSRESKILSQIESSKERARKRSIHKLKDCMEPLSNAVAMKLIENNFIETNSKNAIEEQIQLCFDKLIRSEDFDVDYKIAPFQYITPNFNIVSLYATAFVVEQLVNHKDVIDVFGSDEDIYLCINKQTEKFL